jgi:hypothetical protein
MPGQPPGGGSRQVFVQTKPRKKMSAGLIIGIVVGGVGLLLVMCCGGIFVFGMFTVNAEGKQIAEMLKGNQKLEAEIGELESMTVQVDESNKIEDFDTFVFTAKGSSGSCRVIVKYTTDNDGQINIHWARIKDQQGIESPIYPERLEGLEGF